MTKEEIKERQKNSQKEYYKKNKEKIIEKRKLYRENNKESLKEKRKLYIQNNKEKIKETARLYYQDNINRKKQISKLYFENNKELIKEKRKIYIQNNKELLNKKSKLYNKNNKEKIKETARLYYQNNKEKRKESHKIWAEKNKNYLNDYQKKRRDTDYLYKLKCILRCRIYQSLRNKNSIKSKTTLQMLGCNLETAKSHLEKQFTKGMNWENQGEWHIDHIIPCSSAKTEEELIKLFHYTNLQPLWAADNLSKGDKIIEKQLFLL